ncbi:hypothetical protein ACOSQ2_027273 [Xanthoceras sorbifolium]
MTSRILCDKVRVTCDEGEKERPAALCKTKWSVTKQNVMLQKKAGEVEKDEENMKFEKEHAMKLNFSRRQKFVQEYCTRHMS